MASRQRVLGWGLVTVSAFGIYVTVKRSSSDVDLLTVPSVVQVILATLFILLTLLSSSSAWALLFIGSRNRVALAKGFLVAQLGKYVPGGIVQAASQISLVRRLGYERNTILLALPIFLLNTVVIPGSLCAVLLGLLATRNSLLLNGTLLIVGLATFAIASTRSISGFLIIRILRVVKVRACPDQLPPVHRIRKSLVLGIIAATNYSLAFSTLVGANEHFLLIAIGYFVSFTVGFLTLPVPAGLGVREFVLVLFLGNYIAPVTLISTGVALRLIQLAAELLLGVLAAIRLRQRD